MSNLDNSGRINEIMRGAQASLAFCATTGALACGLGKPPEAMAHSVKAEGGLIGAVAAPPTPFHPLEETRPVTREEIESYLPIAMAESPNSPCNTPKDGKSHGYKINILPGSDDDSDPNNDMMYTQPDGSRRMVMGRSNGNCSMDFLEFTVKGSRGRYNICTVGAHEVKHEDTSESSEGYIAPPSEQDPTGRDKKHDFNNVNSLMYVRNLIQNYKPCASITTDLEPPIELPQSAEPRDYKPQPVDELADRATHFIPRFKEAIEADIPVTCEYYHRSPKAPEFSRRLCYSGENPAKATNSAIVTIKSKFTVDGTESGRPNFKSDKITDAVAQRYLIHGSLSTKEGRLAYRLAKAARS